VQEHNVHYLFDTTRIRETQADNLYDENRKDPLEANLGTRGEATAEIRQLKGELPS
jgi:hypothetical protein